MTSGLKFVSFDIWFDMYNEIDHSDSPLPVRMKCSTFTLFMVFPSIEQSHMKSKNVSGEREFPMPSIRYGIEPLPS